MTSSLTPSMSATTRRMATLLAVLVFRLYWHYLVVFHWLG